jgi:hypothetical protein
MVVTFTLFLAAIWLQTVQATRRAPLIRRLVESLVKILKLFHAAL